ncbi:hypothetical protein NGB36_01850 [Streptomyces sp. RB6PN25]|uniref:Secreted protein n=1 Tax=Streptomyces humicola TaxID=2953240 RepID=A0ABT1PNY8_9ACTN|nr:hypothetical protein [Streptomyces humicola]MCQ4079380.1 hypothetical protein [Streptomyces humicola]
MRNTLRASALITGACGLLLAAAGPSFAQTQRAPTGGFGSGGWGGGLKSIDSDTIADFRIFFHCSSPSRTCINGPVNSGNLWGSQNLWWKSGAADDSGSPTNTNGNTNGHIETHGPQGPKDIQTVR